MAKRKALNEKLQADNPHVRIDEGEVASAAMSKQKMNRLLLMISAAMIAPLMTSADDCQFIISGDPVAASTVDSSAKVSASTALVSGTLSKLTAASSLEARYRTWELSNSTALRSDKAGMIIVVK